MERILMIILCVGRTRVVDETLNAAPFYSYITTSRV